MEKKIIVLLITLLFLQGVRAQDEQTEEKKGFKKENLFTGGSISLSFGSNVFLIGGSPIFGYNLTKWADAGIVVNYTYSSQRDYSVFNDRLRQTVYGGGAFTRLYPVRFLFVQAQAEHNFIRQKYIPRSGTGTQVDQTSANSLLVGGGYTTGRRPELKSGFFYLSVLFDVAGNTNSPYTDAAGRSLPIFRAGVQIPLFQGRRGFD